MGGHKEVDVWAVRLSVGVMACYERRGRRLMMLCDVTCEPIIEDISLAMFRAIVPSRSVSEHIPIYVCVLV